MDLIRTSLHINLNPSESCDFSVDSTKSWNFPLVSTIKLLLGEFLLTSLFLSYGIYLTEFVRGELLSYQFALWTPITFVTVWFITNPISELIHKGRKNEHSQIICLIAALLLTFSIFICSFSLPWVKLQILNYGVIGGVSTSIILTQIKLEAEIEFQSHLKIMEIVSQTSRAISLLVFPHLIGLLIPWVGSFKAQTIHSAIILHIIPIILIKNDDNHVLGSSNSILSRYRTIPGLINSQEMIDLGSPTRKKFVEFDSNETSSSSSNNSSSSSNNFSVDEESEDDEIAQLGDFKNEMGVHVLPQIPEESETDEDEENSHINRLSVLSDKLQEIIVKDENTSEPLVLSVREINKSSVNNIYLVDSDSKTIINEDCYANRMKCCSIINLSPYQKYKYKRCRKEIFCFLQEKILKKMRFCFSLREFYVLLITKSLITFGIVVFVTTIPYLLLENKKDEDLILSAVDCPIVLSAISVMWIFHLFAIPWFPNLSKTQKHVIFVVGLLVVNFSLLPTVGLSNDIIIIFCLIFGLGNGILIHYEETMYSEFIGTLNWAECKESVNVLSGILILAIHAICYVCNVNIYGIYLIVCCSYALVSIRWTIYFLKRLTRYF
ncbi:uncharacterized protein LOC112906733 isoform X2 [Agrilus planipennis]|uniref:Uncharacterized protein LOC108743974 isoform X2 n=1 Tax=Agrilus planipennis TaxID=224129 RepID=A0A1W4XG21_AGRPL|nr:uncharacterized protein LOC108743974 isoform X2 [Agrilus planipennis]XP_025837264.1 uncharacterized protein LOC112906733 isoform X2 [Agrilus planipennis]